MIPLTPQVEAIIAEALAEHPPCWPAADFLGMKEATFNRVYAHHDPDYMAEVLEALD